MTSLPRIVDRVGVPPIKCQGIKTKLVPFIASNIRWESGADGRWIEPFVGSGVVVFNLRPDRALLSDTNEHIIRLYQRIQNGEITQATVRQYLAAAAPLLAAGEADYFYEVRSRFNNSGDSLDFLFLNRSCFNGVMRFNKRVASTYRSAISLNGSPKPTSPRSSIRWDGSLAKCMAKTGSSGFQIGDPH